LREVAKHSVGITHAHKGEDGANFITRTIIIYFHQILLASSYGCDMNEWML
jgi:hypothetical protein